MFHLFFLLRSFLNSAPVTSSNYRSLEGNSMSTLWQISSIPPSTWVKGRGQDKNAQQKVAGSRWFGSFSDFSKMLVELSQMLVVWSEKCVSGVIYWRSWGSKKKGFTCIFTAFYCFQLKNYLFDIKHAKCDLTAKNKWNMQLGSILPRAAFLPKLGFTSQFVWLYVFFVIRFSQKH